jgi:hypothetical protein
MSFTPDCTKHIPDTRLKCDECELPDGECIFDFCKNCLLMNTVKCPQCGAWMNPNLELCQQCQDEKEEESELKDEYINELMQIEN